MFPMPMRKRLSDAEENERIRLAKNDPISCTLARRISQTRLSAIPKPNGTTGGSVDRSRETAEKTEDHPLRRNSFFWRSAKSSTWMRRRLPRRCAARSATRIISDGSSSWGLVTVITA